MFATPYKNEFICFQSEEMRRGPSRQKGRYDYVKHRGEKWRGGGNDRGSVLLEHSTRQGDEG